MYANKLKLNNEINELLVLTTTGQKGNVTIPGLKVGSCNITPKQSIDIISNDSLEDQINTVYKKILISP